MSLIDNWILKVKRREGPVSRTIYYIAKALRSANLPLPRWLKPVYRMLYTVHFGLIDGFRAGLVYFYREPLFRSCCVSAGKRLTLYQLPEIYGHTRIHIGDDVTFHGTLAIASGRFHDEPTLIIKDRAAIGNNGYISVNREVIIEEDVMIANDCWIADSDGHPRAADLRAQNAPLDPRDIRPVRIGRSAWLGRGAQVMKGVTIGEGAIIGAQSVVISDIPPYAIAIGNPAEVILRGAGKPVRATR